MNKLVENLEKVKAVIVDGNSWCRDWEAMKASGEHCYADDKDATKWSLFGAMIKVCNVHTLGKEFDEYFAMYNLIVPMVGNLDHYNNTHKHKEVLKVIDDAIAIAKNPQKAKAA